MNTIRWGILGTGNIANQFATGLSVLDDAELVAVGSRRMETANDFANQYEIPNRHDSYEALASDPEVDIVYVATPHVYHAENSLLCLRNGKAVLCEKPFTINAAQAQEVIETARAQQIFLMEAAWTRFLPHMERIIALVEEGAIGDVRMVQANFGFRTAFDAEKRLFDPALGGGALLDVGVYPIYLAHWLLGAPDTILSTAHLGQSGVDEQAGILFQYDEGCVAVLSSAIRADLPHTAVIAGATGQILIHERWWAPSSFTLHRDARDPERFEPEIAGNGYNYEAAEAMHSLWQGRTESEKFPLDATLEVMRIMDEIRAQWGLRYPGET